VRRRVVAAPNEALCRIIVAVSSPVRILRGAQTLRLDFVAPVEITSRELIALLAWRRISSPRFLARQALPRLSERRARLRIGGHVAAGRSGRRHGVAKLRRRWVVL
jgi:hypothetical protein